MFRTLSPLFVASLLVACARNEAPLDVGVYDAPIERVEREEPSRTDALRSHDVVQAEEQGQGEGRAGQAVADVASMPATTATGGGRPVREPRRRPAPAEPELALEDDLADADGITSNDSFAGLREAQARGDVAIQPALATTRTPSHDAQPTPVRGLIAPGSEHYTAYGVNGFTNPAVDALSTFAVDVDTASYAVTRRKLREGYLPPTAAVRVEEFVNYFPYDYVQPAAGFPFAVDFEAAPSPYNPRNHIVRVGVQGKSIDATERKPVHLTFLVDVSGSMRSSDKIGLLKQSLTLLTQELDDGDTVAIATYAGRTDVVLPPTPIRNSNAILAALDGLTAGGSTAMSSGIDIAYRLADQTFVPGDVNRVIVCSDGDANVGTTSHSVMSEQIRDYAQRGITLTTLGFGNGNYQDTMMERLANDGDGNYFYIDALPEARRVLVDRMTGTLEVIAKDVKIQVEWDPEQVLAYRLIGYENRDVADRDFRNDAVDAGEIGAGHQVTALYEVALVDNPEGQLATVRIRNKAPGPEAPAVERSYALGAKAIGDRFVSASDQFRMATAAAGFAEVLRASPHMSEISLRDVLSIAQDAQRVEYREDAELVELIDQAAKLRGEGAFVLR